MPSARQDVLRLLDDVDRAVGDLRLALSAPRPPARGWAGGAPGSYPPPPFPDAMAVANTSGLAKPYAPASYERANALLETPQPFSASHDPQQGLLLSTLGPSVQGALLPPAVMSGGRRAPAKRPKNKAKYEKRKK